MEKEIFAALREIYVLMVGEMQVTLRPFHLTTEQFDTLLLLQSDSGWRMGDLSSRLLVDNSKMTRIVDYLAENGWAERQPDPDDRRAQRVLLTATGATQRDVAQVAHLTALQTSLAGFDEPERVQLLELLASWRSLLGQIAGG